MLFTQSQCRSEVGKSLYICILKMMAALPPYSIMNENQNRMCSFGKIKPVEFRNAIANKIPPVTIQYLLTDQY